MQDRGKNVIFMKKTFADKVFSPKLLLYLHRLITIKLTLPPSGQNLKQSKTPTPQQGKGTINKKTNNTISNN